jgi:hypothetical protein
MNRIPPQQYNPNMHPQNRGPPPQQGGNQQGNGKQQNQPITFDNIEMLKSNLFFFWFIYNN